MYVFVHVGVPPQAVMAQGTELGCIHHTEGTNDFANFFMFYVFMMCSVCDIWLIIIQHESVSLFASPLIWLCYVVSDDP